MRIHIKMGRNLCQCRPNTRLEVSQGNVLINEDYLTTIGQLSYYYYYIIYTILYTLYYTLITIILLIVRAAWEAATERRSHLTSSYFIPTCR